ncbi:MAG: 50S ribosomal protein L11 methyltransferase, partial [Bacteroidetes bacterium]|nr:50S ribosomal protein L11 methyltransferase [Bacteroidota bacterium]
MRPHKWIKITIGIKESLQDLLVGQLTLIGFNGFVQEENFLNCFMAEKKWTASVKSELQSVLKRFRSEFPSVDSSYGTEIVKEENWNKTWEEQTGIVEATSKIVIKPSWKKLQKKHKNKIILHVDPKMSFGTGHHETTRLSLKLLE